MWELPANAVLEDPDPDPEPDIQVPLEDDATTESWPENNFYYKLRLRDDASLQDIRKAFMTIARQCHPDKCLDTEKEQATEYMKKMNEAYNVLRDPAKRRS